MSEHSRPPRGPRNAGFAGSRSGPTNGGRNRTDSKAPRNSGAFAAKGHRSNSDRPANSGRGRPDNGGYNPVSADRMDNFAIDSSSNSRSDRKDSRRDGAGSNRGAPRRDQRSEGRFGNKPAGGRFGDRDDSRPQARDEGRAQGRPEGPRFNARGEGRPQGRPEGRFGDRPDRSERADRGPRTGPQRGFDRDARPARGERPSFGERPQRTDRAGFGPRGASERGFTSDRAIERDSRYDREPVVPEMRAQGLGQRPARGPARGTDRARDRGFGVSSQGFPGRTEGRPALPAHLRIGGGRRKPRAEVTQKAPGTGERIAKLLARAGVGSRRDIERMITEGRIALDGKVLETPATILTSLKGVTVDDRPVAEAEGTRVYVFHKPSGVITAARDPSGRPTIYDVLPADLPRLVPVGRLDLNTEGLILMTNDGELKRALELPSSGVPRTYRVRALGEVRQQDLEALALGVTIDGVRYGSVDASVDRRARADGANIWLTMTLTEGKNREVRRLCEGMGLKVSRLIRTSYGPFNLGELGVRQIEEANPQMVIDLKAMLRKNARDYAKDQAREDD